MEVPALGLSRLISVAAFVLASIGVPAVAKSPIPAVAQAQQEQLKQAVDTFVSNAFSSNDKPLERRNNTICPLVAGLSKEQGEFILARLSQVAQAAGASLGGEKCNANFFIVFSRDPEPGLKRLENHHDAKGFDRETETQLRQFVDMPRPVRVWYNVGKTNVQGTILVAAILDPSSPAARHFPAPQGLDPEYNRLSPQLNSRLTQVAVTRDIVSVIVVVDSTQIRKFDFGQISDYIGMIGLARVNLDTDLGGAPTILSVFKDSESRPSEITVWDRASLHALYRLPQSNKQQLSELQAMVLSEITTKAQG
jgi:hypothetical protein